MATRESSVREPRTGDAPVAEHAEPAQPATAAPVAEQGVEAHKAEGSTIQLDVAALGEQLMGRWAESRRASRELMRREDFHRIPTDDMHAQRERVLGQLGLLVAHGSVHRAFPKEFGGEDDHGGFIASFEELLLADPSMQIKSGVQWGLYASAILHLGTEQHHQAWLPDALDLSTPGAFAMTETGHGSDVSAVGTTATYDEASDEWVIHTPFRAAWKDYIGNAALHGKSAVVFAQLITRGVNHGVHAFYVPLRDENGDFLAGIGGEDDGLKGGLNGIDNGRLHFSQVRVPRTHLLNRYGSVDENGVYTSPITSPGRRFFTMLGTLVQGRVSLDGACVVASKLATTIAVRYGSERRQFDDGDDNEVVLLDYQRHQRRLLPRLAQTYAMSFAHEVFLEKFDGVFSGRTDTDSDREDLETLAAALKPLSTWAALDIIQEAREATGGQGFLAANRLTQLRADLDIYATFEGDNNVLLQLVAKRLLTDYSRSFAKADAGVMAHYVADQVNEAVMHRSGLRRLVQSVADFGSTARSVGYVRDTASQRQLLTDRVETMVAELAGKLRSASKLPKKDAAALFNRHQNALIETAKAHGELLQWEAFTEALEKVEHEGNRQVLTWLRDLFGLGLIEKNLAWYVIHGRLSDHRAQAITDYIDDRLLPRLRPHALELTDAFELRDEHIRADIATGQERARQEEAREYYASLRARGLAPIDEKDLLAAQKKRAV
ncbi:acyl-CoA dehydrogenase family protein [Microcella pacifica]|uniref:acyl-CoA oxidase n=1 Tax=Microcella pacifica TaxID=2591847 RepID=A0A9E5JSK7_9MICO|nr:acyl-CoA dehydrogenase [Microcella pacifica]NHF64087.1 acyl-CoA dehydrogenase [Microcella pacifica]